MNFWFGWFLKDWAHTNGLDIAVFVIEWSVVLIGLGVVFLLLGGFLDSCSDLEKQMGGVMRLLWGMSLVCLGLGLYVGSEFRYFRGLQHLDWLTKCIDDTTTTEAKCLNKTLDTKDGHKMLNQHRQCLENYEVAIRVCHPVKGKL